MNCFMNTYSTYATVLLKMYTSQTVVHKQQSTPMLFQWIEGLGGTNAFPMDRGPRGSRHPSLFSNLFVLGVSLSYKMLKNCTMV